LDVINPINPLYADNGFALNRTTPMRSMASIRLLPENLNITG
jgi:hypothetical protein